MARSYMHCFRCKARMKKFRDDPEGDGVFYYCRNCGRRWTYMPERGATAEDWPKDVFDEAVASGVMSEDGRFL